MSPYCILSKYYSGGHDQENKKNKGYNEMPNHLCYLLKHEHLVLFQVFSLLSSSKARQEKRKKALLLLFLLIYLTIMHSFLTFLSALWAKGTTFPSLEVRDGAALWYKGMMWLQPLMRHSDFLSVGSSAVTQALCGRGLPGLFRVTPAESGDMGIWHKQYLCSLLCYDSQSPLSLNQKPPLLPAAMKPWQANLLVCK